jgi:hypothetical protein
MIEIISYQFLLVIILAFTAGFLKTTFGIGAGVFLTPIASLFIDPKIAIGLLAPLMFASDITTLYYHWKKWDKKQIFIIVPFGLIGIVLGSAYISWVSNESARVSIGIIAIIFSSLQLYKFYVFSVESYRPFHASAGMCISLISGVASAIAHSGGIVLTFYLMTLRLSKYAFISTLTVYLLFNDILKIFLYYKFEILNNHLLLLSFFVMPVLIAGSSLGNKAVVNLSYKQFVLIINTLIFVSGFILIAGSF